MLANQPLLRLIGVKSFNVPKLTEDEYIELVDFTGREWHSSKRGKFKLIWMLVKDCIHEVDDHLVAAKFDALVGIYR